MVFFFAVAPRGRSLTHCGPGWRCLPLAGVVFFFFAAALPGPGWCFFFCCGPARTLLNGASPSPAFSRGRSKNKKHPGWCFFFALAPCRRPTGLLLPLPFAGAAAKNKKTPWVVFCFCSGHVPARGFSWCFFFCFALAPPKRARGFSYPCLSPGPEQKKQHPGWCFFFLLWPRRKVAAPNGAQQKKNRLCTPGADSKKNSRNQ